MQNLAAAILMFGVSAAPATALHKFVCAAAQRFRVQLLSIRWCSPGVQTPLYVVALE